MKTLVSLILFASMCWGLVCAVYISSFLLPKANTYETSSVADICSSALGNSYREVMGDERAIKRYFECIDEQLYPHSAGDNFENFAKVMLRQIF